MYSVEVEQAAPCLVLELYSSVYCMVSIIINALHMNDTQWVHLQACRLHQVDQVGQQDRGYPTERT